MAESMAATIGTALAASAVTTTATSLPEENL